jgi:hypothetical protein
MPAEIPARTGRGTMDRGQRWVGWLVGVAVLVGAAGCATGLGPRVISKERMDYNQFIADSQNEQLLLNLVRLHYQDPPLFLELNTVVATYSMGVNASGGMAFDSSARQSGTLGAGVNFSTTPTVNYTTLQGEAFAKRMLTPIAPETLALLVRSGWSVERLLHVCVERINGLDHSPGSARQAQSIEAFEALVEEMRLLQKAGPRLLSLQLPGANQAPRLLLALPEEVQDDERRLVTSVRARLGLDHRTREFRLVNGSVATAPDEIAIQGRSLLSVMFFLAGSVETPSAHVRAGWVKGSNHGGNGRAAGTPAGAAPDPAGAAGLAGTAPDRGALTRKVMTIHAQRGLVTDAFVKVSYRGHTYFVPDDDPESKTTFSLLTYLFSLQAAQGAGGAPMLTLPLGR